MSKRRAEITDRVTQFVAVFQDHIVRVFQIPVVNQRHHDLETLQLRRADERILFPFPLACSFPTLRTCLKPDVGERSFTGNRDARHEVVDLCCVTEPVKQSDGRSLRLSFLSDLRNPLMTRSVADAILLRVAALLLFYERDASQIWTHGCAAWSQKKIA